MSEDIKKPIFKRDLVYTPLWSAGQTNAFSFVGLIDLDGDKISDREKLHKIIENSGGIIDNEVNDQGEFSGKGLSVDTRYLVFGRIPDVKEVLENEKPAIIDMQEQKTILINQARIHAVETINLNEFLSFIGYHPTRRVWFPGNNNPFNLELGKRKPGKSDNNRKAPTQGKRKGSRFFHEKKYR